MHMQIILSSEIILHFPGHIPLSVFCEQAIAEMGVNPILARDGYDSWTFHKGSSEIRIFVYENTVFH